MARILNDELNSTAARASSLRQSDAPVSRGESKTKQAVHQNGAGSPERLSQSDSYLAFDEVDFDGEGATVQTLHLGPEKCLSALVKRPEPVLKLQIRLVRRPLDCEGG